MTTPEEPADASPTCSAFLKDALNTIERVGDPLIVKALTELIQAVVALREETVLSAQRLADLSAEIRR